MNPFLIEDELKMKSHIFHISIQVLFMKMCYAEYDNEADLKMQAQNRINL